MPVPFPLIRALLPFCLGIWAGDCYPLTEAHTLVWGGVASLLLLLVLTYLLERYHLRHSASLGVTYSDSLFIHLTLFLLGAALCTFHRPETPQPASGTDDSAASTYLFELQDTPLERERTYRSRAIVLARKERADTLVKRTQKQTYLLYVNKKGFNPSDWGPGKRIIAHTTLRPFTQLPDSFTFDYPTYARRRGWSGSAYIARGKWRPCPPLASTAKSAWWDRISEGIASCRHRLTTYFSSSTLDTESLGLITALTLGDKSLLPQETKAIFSQTGVSHLLALSGLHVGILFTLFMLPTLPLGRRFRWVRSLFLLLVLASLWGFALLTGLSASVVRSVTMYSIFIIGLLVDTPNASLNKLAGAVALLLIVRPYWLFDVGFQLSCIGVASILYLAPPIQALYTPGRRWTKRLWNFCVVSTAAQIGTAPLVACYFGTFSPYFLLANLWGIPLVTLLLYTSFAWISCYALGAAFFHPAMALVDTHFPTLFGGLSHLLSRGLHLIQQLPCACIHVPRPDTTECFISYAILLLLPLLQVKERRFSFQLTMLILLLLWLLSLYHYFLR